MLFLVFAVYSYMLFLVFAVYSYFMLLAGCMCDIR